jgi:hypothetical protein
MSLVGQSRPGRPDSRLGYVGFPLIAIHSCGAATFRDVPRTDMALHQITLARASKSMAG